MFQQHRLAAATAMALAVSVAAGESPDFRPLFNSQDLTGWVNVNTHDTTWTVRDGMIVCSGKPIGELRTDRQYENFILEMEWRHLHPGGNAGLFVWADAIPARGQPFIRSIEVQVLDGPSGTNATSHGDVFAIHGATMKPDRPHPGGWMRCLPNEHRGKPAGQWNHYRVTCQDGNLKLAVNGKVVSGASDCRPRKGYLCLESEGSETHFRNLRIQELPSTDPLGDEVAALDRGLRPLYQGLDLAGWRVELGHQGHWTADDWRLRYDGESAAEDPNLWIEATWEDFDMILDWRWGSAPLVRTAPVVLEGYRWETDETELEVRAWHRLEITRTDRQLSATVDGRPARLRTKSDGAPAAVAIGLAHQGVPVTFANVLIRSSATISSAAKKPSSRP